MVRSKWYITPAEDSLYSIYERSRNQNEINLRVGVTVDRVNSLTANVVVSHLMFRGLLEESITDYQIVRHIKFEQ